MGTGYGTLSTGHASLDNLVLWANAAVRLRLASRDITKLVLPPRGDKIQ